MYSACGSPCEKQCSLHGRGDVCLGVRECTRGCYCPEVNISYFISPSLVIVFIMCIDRINTHSHNKANLDHSSNIKIGTKCIQC